MAGRNTKTNFDFFRLDTTFFSNKKIKALRRRFGSVGILTYLYILSYAYGNNGYYVRIDSLYEFAYDIAESIGNSNLTQIASVATDCINYLASRGEINKHLLDKGVISGESIQRQYIEMCLAAKRKVEIKEEYRLVDTFEYPIAKNTNCSEEIAINSEEIAINSEETPQSKGKENKDISQSVGAREEDEFERKFKAFCEKWDITDDNYYSSLILDLDFDKLDKAYSESPKYLGDKKEAPWAHTLSGLVKKSPSILAGKYKGRKSDGKKQKEQDTHDILQNVFNHLKAEEEGNGNN